MALHDPWESRTPVRAKASDRTGVRCSQEQNQGFVLIMALWYLLVISLLVMNALNTSTLQTQITTRFYAKTTAFQNAESALVAAESAITGNELSGSGGAGDSSYTYQKRPEVDCGVMYFQVDAIGKSKTAQSHLESILLVPISPPPSCPNPIPARGRVAWQEL